LPAHIKPRYSTGDVDGNAASRRKKGKCKEGEDDLECDKQIEASQENCLATLDIFAGCGGLSEGLKLSGKLNSLFPFFSFLFYFNATMINLISYIIKALDDWQFAARKTLQVSH
jgi:hypothetical protein